MRFPMFFQISHADPSKIVNGLLMAAARMLGDKEHPDGLKIWSKIWFSKKLVYLGGFKYFVFSPLPGEMIQFDYFSNGLKVETTN